MLSLSGEGLPEERATTVGLMSETFLIVLVITAIAVVALALWLWPRAAKKGPIPWLGRLGLVVVTQVAILCVVLVAANKSYGFYSSWTDLFGGSVGKQVLIPGRDGPHPAALVVKGRNDGGLKGAKTASGEVESVTFHGQSSGLTADGSVYLPPQYFAKGHGNDRFPVVVTVTDGSGAAHDPVTGLKLPRTVADDIAAKKIKPAIYVMVHLALTPGHDTSCTDAPGGPQALAFFTQDLPMAVAGQYRTVNSSGSWGAIGDSAGGYCALKLAMTNPARYGAAAGLAVDRLTPQGGRPDSLYAGNAQVRDENDLIWRVQHMPAPPVSLLVGGNDSAARQFARSAKAPTKVFPLPQGTGANEQAEYAQAVTWMDKQLTAELP